MHPLQMMLDEAGIETRSYSGRGMYGKECLGADIDRGGLGSFMADVIMGMEAHVAAENREEIAEAFRSMSTDSMGLGMIVYFPGVPYEGDTESEDDEDGDDEDEGDDDA